MKSKHTSMQAEIEKQI